MFIRTYHNLERGYKCAEVPFWFLMILIIISGMALLATFGLIIQGVFLK